MIASELGRWTNGATKGIRPRSHGADAEGRELTYANAGAPACPKSRGLGPGGRPRLSSWS